MLFGVVLYESLVIFVNLSLRIHMETTFENLR